jgi:phage/plasmid-associated DNA primase
MKEEKDTTEREEYSEEIIKGTDPKIAGPDDSLEKTRGISEKTIGDFSKSVSEDENNLTSSLSKDLFVNFMALQNSGNLDSESETDLINSIDDTLRLTGMTVNGKLKQAYLESFRRVGRKFKPQDAPVKWIQFKDKAYSITSGDIHNIKSNYFFTNPIPYKIGESTETPVMDKLFEEWVGKERVKTLYEIIAYCCYRDYPIHTIICMVGTGRNGKSQFQRLMRKFLGVENVCDTELDDLMNSRFEGFGLYSQSC